MPGFLIRGALVEYGTNVLGPLPNIVVFQFNPEEISRTFEIRSRSTDNESGGRQRERAQASAPPTETFSITAHFSAVDDLGNGGALAAIPAVFGVGPALAALEKMVYPSAGFLSGLIGGAVDAIGSALGGGQSSPSRPVPREALPRILFIWGPARVLPVEIRSMSIKEKQYDALLNPTLAEVQIGMAVAQLPPDTDDKIGQGALSYTNTVKEVQVGANFVKAIELALDVIPF
ncbi:MAG: hypothetical protein ACK5AZ_13725 [Bryobacteraceae bacterium]